jgi:type IV secretory pathway protease TraF
MKQTLLGGAMTVCVSVLVTACGLLAYDRLVVRPAQVIGVVDVAEIYRLKEAEFAALMTRGNSDADRQQAMDLATSFARAVAPGTRGIARGLSLPRGAEERSGRAYCTHARSDASAEDQGGCSMNATTRPGLRHGRFLAWLGAGARTVIADARRHRLVFVAFGAIWALALTRVFIHHTPILPVLFNWTASLPYRIVVVDHGPMPLARGDLIVYAFDGEAAERDYPGLKRQPFFKRIAGVAGDVVTVDGRDVFINGCPWAGPRPTPSTAGRWTRLRPLSSRLPCLRAGHQRRQLRFALSQQWPGQHG